MADDDFDVAIVGGGVVGCAILQELTSKGIKCVLCEQNEAILSGASCGNSGTLHTGFDAPLNSLELECIKTARDVTEDIFVKNSIPYRTCGALVVAWSEDDLEKLPSLVEHSLLAGVTDAKQITQNELRQMEPHLNPNALGAVFIPNETIVDPWCFPACLAFLGISQGGCILTGCKVKQGTKDHRGWHLSTNKGPIHAKVVINCSGLFGDKVEEIVRRPPFDIKPRKGQYAVFSQSAQSLLNSIVFPVPTERTKGVLLFPSVYGNIIVGPTAEDQDDRVCAAIDKAVIDQLVQKAHNMLPALRDHEVIGTYAGLRPATQFKDYQMEFVEGKDWLTVSGIRSTGLSACLGIAKHAFAMIQQQNIGFNRKKLIKEEPENKSLESDSSSVLFNGNKWKITHPLTLFGLQTQKGLDMMKHFID